MNEQFKCPLCGWVCSNKSQMCVHIKYGHSEDDINAAVDDGRIIENPTFFFTPAPRGENTLQERAKQ